MSNSYSKEITNWGLYPKIKAEVIEETSVDKIIEHVKKTPSIIARGNGRCYGDASLNENIFSSLRLNRFISFDRNTGIINCESGVLLSEILEISIPAGFFLPVTPGTKFITIGGALASDVHGKNHHIDGCFSQHVIEFTLITAQAEHITCTPHQNQELYWSTIGGMGLTGIITSVKFKLKKIETAYIKHEALKANNLDEIFRYFDESESWTYTVAWIDCLQKDKHLGRSILFRGEHATKEELPHHLKEKPLYVKPKKKITIPFYFPNFILNTLTVKIFNFLYFNKQISKYLKNFVDYDTFYYPLDAVNDWNKIYGKNGFIQYQFVIPKETGKEGMKAILKTIANSGQGSFLAVLKLFGKNNPLAYNSFPYEGYTLALDFKRNNKLESLIIQLDKIIQDYGGRIYRTKDAMSNSKLTDYLRNIENDKYNSTQNRRIKNSK